MIPLCAISSAPDAGSHPAPVALPGSWEWAHVLDLGSTWELVTGLDPGLGLAVAQLRSPWDKASPTSLSYILLLHLFNPNTSLVLHVLPVAGHRHSQMSPQHLPSFRGAMGIPALLASQ